MAIGLVLVLLAGLGPMACGGSDPAKIEVELNVRNLCNYSLSGEAEVRCVDDTACDQQSEFCWDPPPDLSHLQRGFCRECETDANCDTSSSCDNGWCHPTCTQDGDCASGTRCTGGLCRPPHFTDFSFCNSGGRDLEIYPGQTAVHGDADACAFIELEWAEAGDPIVVSADDCIGLRIHFRPPALGEFRAWINIFSSDESLNPLPLLLCGQAVEAVCSVAIDGTCPECASCTPEDFTGMEAKDPGCS